MVQQDSDRDFIVVRDSPIHGTGVFAKRPIPRGTRVIAYAGRRWETAALMAAVARDERTLTYVLNLDGDRVVDGAEDGNDARFVNHSCAPNCEVYIFDDTPYVYAMSEIPEGTELTFDYMLQSAEGLPMPRAVERKLLPCHCGAAACRGTMAAPSRRARTRR